MQSLTTLISSECAEPTRAGLRTVSTNAAYSFPTGLSSIQINRNGCLPSCPCSALSGTGRVGVCRRAEIDTLRAMEIVLLVVRFGSNST